MLPRAKCSNVVCMTGSGLGRLDDSDAHHRFRCDKSGQLLLAEAIGAGGPLWNDEPPDLGAAVPGLYFEFRVDIDPDLAEHLSGLARSACPERRILVPVGRKT